MDNRNVMPEKPVKVLYLIERLARAGTELHLLKILQRLDRARFEPVLCCLSESTSDKSLAPPDVPCRFLNAGWNLARPSTLLLYRRVRKIIASEKPDVLHAFLFVANAMAPFAARGLGVRAVVLSRGRMGIEWEAHFLHQVLQRAADRRCDAIVCKTAAMRDEIARVEKVPPEKIRVIPNGVDTAHFRYEAGRAAESRAELAARRGIPAEGPLLLAVGNLKPIKGHATLIEGAAALAREFPRFQLVIVGEGESRAELEGLIEARNLTDRVRLPGAVEDVRPWLRAADIFVAPSLSEGMPNAVLEAMAMGLPLVLSNIAGHVEAVGGEPVSGAGEKAWFFEPGDARGLAGALGDALRLPEERARRGRAGLERVHSELSLDAMVRRIEDLYESLLARRR